MVFLADAVPAAGWSGAVIALIGLVYLIVQQRGARTAAGEAKDKAQETKIAVEETKAVVDEVAARTDLATVAELLRQSVDQNARSAAALARCESQNRENVAVINNLRREVDILKAQVEGLKAAFSAIKGTA